MRSRIMVVDDAEVNRELLREILEDEYIVDTAPSWPADAENGWVRSDRRDGEERVAAKNPGTDHK